MYILHDYMIYKLSAIVNWCILYVLAPADHVLMSNRSFAFWADHNYEQALRDAQIVIHLRPDWPKVSLY